MNFPAEKKRSLEERLRQLQGSMNQQSSPLPTCGERAKGEGTLSLLSPPSPPFTAKSPHPPFANGKFPLYPPFGKGGLGGFRKQGIPGQWITSDGRRVFHVREKVSLSQRHGSVTLQSWIHESYEGLFVICKQGWGDHPVKRGNLTSKFDPKRCVFLDTETTGLAGGTGTVAFLVGCATLVGRGAVNRHVEGKGAMRALNPPLPPLVKGETQGGFSEQEREKVTVTKGNSHFFLQIDQFFIGDFDAEELLLRKLLGSLKEARFLITFNGKAYDREILEARFRLHGLRSPFEDLIHLDLLHASRRIWKEALPDCTLKTLEKKVLNFERLNDIPSEEIPRAYFDYLTHRNPSRLPQIFKHNQLDLLSLVALAAKLNHLYLSGEAGTQEKTSIGKIFYSLREKRKACDWFRDSLVDSTTMQARRGRVAARDRAVSPHLSSKVSLPEAVKKLYSLCLKSEGRYEEAVQLWEDWTRKARFFDPFPFEELAKYYEHKARDFTKALQITEESLKRLRSRPLDLAQISNWQPRGFGPRIHPWQLVKARLLHRHRRLLKKAQI